MKRYVIWLCLSLYSIWTPNLRSETTNQEESVYALCLPIQNREKVFSPLTNQANFTVFSNVNDVTVTANGTLSFTLASANATLGWGNYQGVQAATNVQDLWEERNNVYLRVKQSGSNSTWVAQWWADGARMSSVALITNTLAEGGAFSNLYFAFADMVPTPDGLELRISGSAGNQFEIEWLKVEQPRAEGYARKEFVLPTGVVWRAVATVGGAPDCLWYGVNSIKSVLYINGQEVKRRGARYIYGTAPVDITQYLQPGTNCVGFYGYRVGPAGYRPYLLFQSRIQMDSGQSVSLKSDTTWKTSPTNAAGWNQPGFDDSSWTNITSLFGSDPPAKVYTNEYCVLKNPFGKDLFYTSDSDVRFEVWVPQGVQSTTPGLDYTFSSTDAEGQSTPVQQGTVTNYASTNNSLVYPINVGTRARGVYTLTCTLRDTNGVIEETPVEPVMVIRKLTPTEIQGTNWYEGLNVILEDTIDFTNPNDPHPWIEAQKPAAGPWPAVTNASLVTTNGLTYRETAGYYFSYRFQFEQPGAFYLLELEYPDDADREFEVGIATKFEEMWSNDQSGVGVHTGAKWPKTHQMQTLRWIHVADTNVQSVDIVNIGVAQRPGVKAAAKSFKVYRIVGDLPAVMSGTNRLFGIHTERSYDTSGIGMNFGIGQHKTQQQLAQETNTYSTLQRNIRKLRFYQDTTERYTQYLKFCGQNTHIMGVYQYNDENTPFEHPYEMDTARIILSMKSVLANTLSANGISFYAGVEWSQSRSATWPIFANNAQVAKGADTVWMVDANGKQFNGFYGTVVPNWIHPLVSNELAEVMEELTDKFGHLSGYKGVHGFIGPNQGSGYWVPAFGLNYDFTDPFHFSYDDATFRRFEQETGVSLGISTNDPQRFAQRSSQIRSPTYRPTYVNWRCQKLQKFLQAELAGLRHQTNNLQFLSTLAIEEPAFFQYWLSQGQDYGELLKDFGIDLGLLSQIEGLSVGRWTISWRQAGSIPPTQDPYLWLSKVDSRVTSAYTDETNRYVLARSSWNEGAFAAPGYESPGHYSTNYAAKTPSSDWIMDWTRTEALPQPGGYYCREALIQGLVASDANILISGFTDLGINVGNEQEIRDIMKVFTHLPPERFETVLGTGFESNLVIRKLVKNGVTWFYLVNPGYWPVAGSVTLTAASDLLDVVTGNPPPVEQRNGKVILPVTLTPYGMAAYKVNSASVTFDSLAVDTISEDELAHMASILARLESLLASGVQVPNRWDLAALVERIRQALKEGNYGAAWSWLTQAETWLIYRDWPVCYVATNGNDMAAGTNWTTALATISNAVMRLGASSNGVVVISNGVYALATNVVVQGATIVGFSGNPADTIVDGQGLTRCFSLQNNAAVLAGLTLRNGRADNGGAVYMTGGMVTNCIFVGNLAYGGVYGGGAIYGVINSAVQTCRVDSCIFSNNAATNAWGGAIFFYHSPQSNFYSSLTLNCQITSNKANYGGGGISSGGIISNCVVRGNIATNSGYGYGGGIRSYGFVVDCPDISGNTGYRGGRGLAPGGER